MTKTTNRIGETRIASNGMKMTIIHYNNSHDVDIEFEDGCITYHKRYDRFLMGYISHPIKANRNPNKKDKIGLKKLSKNGLWVEIINYMNNKDITVKFEDGTIFYHKSMEMFNKGATFGYSPQRVGLKVKSKNGLYMEIVAYRKRNDIDIQFEDGYIVYHKSIDAFKKGSMFQHNPNNISKFTPKFIGQKIVCKNGLKAEIIEYKNNKDVTVQFEDGVIIKHIPYEVFNRGNASNYRPLDNTQTIIEYKNALDVPKLKHIGESTILKSGEKVTIIDYKSFEDITVQFEDGTTRKTTYQCFKKCYIHNPNKKFYTVSFEEFLLSKYLEKYNFIRVPPGGLQDIDKDFGMMEFDIYNPKLKIAIEYDGPWHKKHPQKDIKKDNICKKNNIKIIRIRNGCDLLISDISKQIPFKFIGNTYKNFPELIAKIKETYPMDLNYIQEGMPDIGQYIQEFYKFVNKANPHLGESKLSKCGLKMTIIEYINSHNITVEFEDGYVVKHRQYHDFQKDGIKYINRVGESITIKNGLIATIIAYRKSTDIDVKFSDDSYGYHKTYANFKRGRIAPDKK